MRLYTRLLITTLFTLPLPALAQQTNEADQVIALQYLLQQQQELHKMDVLKFVQMDRQLTAVTNELTDTKKKLTDAEKKQDAK